MQTITTYLTFNDQAEEAVKFYTSVFSNSSLVSVNHYLDGAHMPAGTVLSIAFQLNGQTFVALNGGSYSRFSEGISLFVNSETQAEIDHYWEKLSEGGEKGQCGWLKDKFGVSWQVGPSRLDNMLRDNDSRKAKRVMTAMMKMDKIDIDVLEEAYAD